MAYVSNTKHAPVTGACFCVAQTSRETRGDYGKHRTIRIHAIFVMFAYMLPTNVQHIIIITIIIIIIIYII